MMTNWMDKNVLILGAARQGLALARFLCAQGATITLNDQRPADQLQAAQALLAGLPVRWVLGEHPLALLDDTDLLAVSGGVPLTLPLVVEAIRRGVPVTNDSQIFMEAVPCPVVAITGSAGKTTTTTLLGRMAQAGVTAPRKVWVGGNIGLPLVEYLAEMKHDDLVILELSSFQLELMTRSPQVAAVLNITPNHLDRHGTLEAYTTAKARILDFQSIQDIAVLNREDPGSWELRSRTPGRVISFGFERPAPGEDGAFEEDGWLCFMENGEVTRWLPVKEIELRGRHNVLNVLAACAIAHAAGLSTEAMRAGVRGFTGVAHRLDYIRTWHGARWYNDSIATAPERTSAAVHAFSEPLVLLLGGRDKKLPWDDLTALIRRRVDHVVVFGEAAGIILQSLGETRPDRRPYTITRCGGLYDAVQAAAGLVEDGDVVLLSPGCTSFDEFHDFEERGERFKQWVNQLA